MPSALSRFDDLPLALHAASAVLGSRAGVVIDGAWTPVVTPDGVRWGLPVRLDLAGAAPTEHVPPQTAWVVTVNAEDLTVRMYPARADDAVAATFYHQEYNGRADPAWDVRSGYLCTQTSTHKLAQGRVGTYDEPVDLFDRVLWHVERAARWLRRAATDTLVEDGDPFELPDFRTQGPDASTLATYEDAASLARWSEAPRAGIAEFAVLGTAAAPVAVVKGWFGPRGADLFRPAWGPFVAENAGPRSALWLRLDELPAVAPWRAPATGPELLAAARAQGLDPRELLAPLWRHLRGARIPLLIVGAPIPNRFGGPPAVMHWQALRLPSLAKEAPRTRRLRNHLDFARVLGRNTTLTWIPVSENWHPDVLENRGRLSVRLRSARTVIAGTGALGSDVAETVVRMGLHAPVLVDPGRFEAGNAVRHRLTLAELGHGKAPALADRLNAANPSARVAGYEVELPTTEPEVVEALAVADLVLDLTASDALLHAVPDLGLRPDALVVSASVGLFAERLYLFADKADRFSAEAFDRWFEPYRRREHERAEREGLPQAAGCWHPVTPVPYHRLHALAGLLVERLDQIVAAGGARVSEVLEWPLLGSLRSAA